MQSPEAEGIGGNQGAEVLQFPKDGPLATSRGTETEIIALPVASTSKPVPWNPKYPVQCFVHRVHPVSSAIP